MIGEAIVLSPPSYLSPRWGNEAMAGLYTIHFFSLLLFPPPYALRAYLKPCVFLFDRFWAFFERNTVLCLLTFPHNYLPPFLLLSMPA